MNKQSVCVRGFVSGKVQGVGFRYFVQRHANQYGVNGFARNLPDGQVEVLLSGSQEVIWEMKKLVLKGPLLSRVDNCVWQDEAWQDIEGFTTG